MFEAPSDSKTVISLEKISKAYGIPYDFSLNRLARFLTGNVGAFRRDNENLVLKDLSLEVRRGELLGVIGRNGAGKSTMLKVISGVSAPNAGKVKLRGRIFPMIELNAGMNPRFTGRENVYLLAAIMNISRKVIDARMGEIEEFCDLGEHFDQPVRTYSSGMPGRLGFAVAVHADADIVLIDEVLAVGDVSFRNRCTAKMEELRDSGKTLVLVSHNMQAISALCTRTIVLEQGEIKFDGPTAGGIQVYTDLMQSLTLRKLQKGVRLGSEKIKSDNCSVWGLRVANGRGEPMPIVNPSKVLRVSFNVATGKGLNEGLAFIRIENAQNLALVDESWIVRFPIGEAQRKLTFEFPRTVPLKTGQYTLTVGLMDKFGALALASLSAPLVVSGSGRGGRGLIQPKYRLFVTEVEKEERAPREMAG